MICPGAHALHNKKALFRFCFKSVIESALVHALHTKERIDLLSFACISFLQDVHCRSILSAERCVHIERYCEFSWLAIIPRIIDDIY